MSQLGADGRAIGGAALIYQEPFQVPRSHEDGLAAAFASSQGKPGDLRRGA